MSGLKHTDHKSVEVTSLPPCDMHPSREAAYDCKTSFGPWGNLCKQCYQQYGVGLGLGKGQRLILKGGK